MTTVAFFDLDYTLLNTSSGLVYIKSALRHKRVSPWVVGYVGLLYRLGVLDFGQAHARLITRVGRHGPAEAAAFFNGWIPQKLFPCLTPAGKAKIEWHRQQGHRVVLVSASIEEIVSPVAGHLGLGADYLCTRLHVENGRYTGRLEGPACYGPGKVERVKAWAAQNGLDFPLPNSYFYTDSPSDLPLLEQVSHPVAVNPSPRLAKIARARGWPVEQFY